MIDEKIMDEILPLPDKDDLASSIEEELKAEGFILTNFSAGGVFYTLMMILIQIRIELVTLFRKVLNNMFIKHADEAWLELKGTDFSKTRKQPVKTRGYITISRVSPGEAIKIAKGNLFKTDQDINGEELGYLVVENVTMPKDILSFTILVEAEKEGSVYNVPVGQIKNSLTHIEGIDAITNDVSWITQEGSDLESIESFRSRILNSWAELSSYPIRDKYKNVCEAVSGVLFVRVDDDHPRGQGTIDIIVTSTAGAASEGLLDLVTIEAEKIKGPYDNLLVKSSETVNQDVSVTVWISMDASDEGLSERVESIIIDLLRIREDRNLNELNHADIIYALRKDVAILKNVRVTAPVSDVALDSDKVIILGNINVTIMRG